MALNTGSTSVAEPVPRHHDRDRPATSVAIPVVRRLLGVLWIGSLATVVLLALVTNLGPRFGLEVFAIRGGSMTPTIPVGAAVIAVSAEPGSIRAGNIVTIRADNGVIYTHRVVEVDDSEADVWLHTKGDANTTADAAPVPLAAVVGKVEMVVPLGGYLIALLATPAGIVSFLAYAVALLLVIGELEAVGSVADRQPRFARVPDVTRT
jgi:signal peptidase I